MTNRKLTGWIDRRLRETTHLGESSALVANDLAANRPTEKAHVHVSIIEIRRGKLYRVCSNLTSPTQVILVDHDAAEVNPESGAWHFQSNPLSALDQKCKAIMFDAGITLGKLPIDPESKNTKG